MDSERTDRAQTPQDPDHGEATRQVHAQARVARRAAHVLATATRATKDAALVAMAEALEKESSRILAANAADLDAAVATGTADHLLDRLRLDDERVAGMAAGLREVASLPDPVGEVVRGSTLPNGLRLKQLRVPFGVIGIIYEARPNVTADAAGICLKSGNAALLRGSASSARSNAEIVEVLSGALAAHGLPRESVQLVAGSGRESARALMRARGLVDLLIPRGGAGLIRSVVEESSVPVIETGVGNCHIYLDARADTDQALAIVLNSKTHRPSVCNAVETVLVHSDLVPHLLASLVTALQEAGVRVHGDARVQAIEGVVAATEADWDTEYLSLDLAMGVVDSLDEAVDHIRVHSSGHTEAIVTDSVDAAHRFVSAVDSAAVMVNASTRFTDGSEFGFGAEIGISTQKLHARGPMGLPEMTSTKYVVTGEGQIR